MRSRHGVGGEQPRKDREQSHTDYSAYKRRTSLMRDVVTKLKGRLQHGLAIQEVLDRLARSGVVFYPYIVFREFADARFQSTVKLPRCRIKSNETFLANPPRQLRVSADRGRCKPGLILHCQGTRESR
jgi:hypothetical protein